MRLAQLLAVAFVLACGSRSGLEVSGADGDVLGGGAGHGGSGGGGGSGGTATACAFGATPVSLAQGIPGAYGIAVDESFVFVTSAVDGGNVYRIPKVGGTAVAVASGLGRPRHLALDATRVFVTSPMDGRVLGLNKVGNWAVSLMPPTPGHPEGIARTSTTTFWVRAGPGAKSGALLAWESLEGGAVALAAGLDSPGPLVADGGEIFWIDNSSGGTPGIWHFAQATTLAPQLFAPLPAANGNDLALDESHVYYAMNAEIGRVSRGGGARELLSPGVFAHGLALGGGYVYWVEGGATTSGRLARTPRAGGATETLATGFDVPRDVALDDACVYWTNQGAGDAGGSVMVRAR